MQNNPKSANDGDKSTNSALNLPTVSLKMGDNKISVEKIKTLLETLKESITCPVCWTLSESPIIQFSCLHSACRQCYEENEDEFTKCPICKATVWTAKTSPILT